MDTLVIGRIRLVKIKQIGHFSFKWSKNVDYSSVLFIIGCNRIPFYGFLYRDGRFSTLQSP